MVIVRVTTLEVGLRVSRGSIGGGGVEKWLPLGAGCGGGEVGAESLTLDTIQQTHSGTRPDTKLSLFLSNPNVGFTRLKLYFVIHITLCLHNNFGRTISTPITKTNEILCDE